MYQDSIHGKCEYSLELFHPWNSYHNSTRSNLVLTPHFQEDKKVYIMGPEFQRSMGWQLRCSNISKDRVKHTCSHQTLAERLKQDINPLKDPGGSSLSPWIALQGIQRVPIWAGVCLFCLVQVRVTDP